MDSLYGMSKIYLHEDTAVLEKLFFHLKCMCFYLVLQKVADTIFTVH